MRRWVRSRVVFYSHTDLAYRGERILMVIEYVILEEGDHTHSLKNWKKIDHNFTKPDIELQ